MNCHECGHTMTTQRTSLKYDASGLPGITLENIEVRRCVGCGETEWVIPRMEQLHALIAATILRKPSRLTPQEIRFLRKHLGWSGADFARMIGTKPETVSRWESGATPMGVQADRLLRLMVAHLKPTDEVHGEEEIKENRGRRTETGQVAVGARSQRLAEQGRLSWRSLRRASSSASIPRIRSSTARNRTDARLCKEWRGHSGAGRAPSAPPLPGQTRQHFDRHKSPRTTTRAYGSV